MNASQKKFYTFILERTQAEHQEDMRHLLAELVERQSTNELNKMYLMGIMPRALSYLKPESINEVKKVVAEFSEKM